MCKKLCVLLLALVLLLQSASVFCFADERIEVSRVVATSDFTPPAYGAQVKGTPATGAFTFTMTEGTMAYIPDSMCQWLKYVDGTWKVYTDVKFTEGMYMYNAQLRIDGVDGARYKLAQNIELYVNGISWLRTEGDVTYHERYSYKWFTSPTYTVTREEDLPLEFNNNGRYDVPVSFVNQPIAPYSVLPAVVGGQKPYVFHKVSGPSWVTVANDGTVSGTPTKTGKNEELVIRVIDLKDDAKTITVTVNETYQSNTISRVIATSDMTAPVAGAPLQFRFHFTVSEGRPAYFPDTMGRWLKKNGDEWERYYEDTFTAGVYKYAAQLRIDGVNGELCKLADSISVTVDGKAWTHNAKTEESDYSYVTVVSPEYVVESTGLLGDANNSGAVDSTDARLVLQYAVKKIDATKLDLSAADVNGSGAVDSTDARLILQYAVKKISKFPAA